MVWIDLLVPQYQDPACRAVVADIVGIHLPIYLPLHSVEHLVEACGVPGFYPDTSRGFTGV